MSIDDCADRPEEPDVLKSGKGRLIREGVIELIEELGSSRSPEDASKYKFPNYFDFDEAGRYGTSPGKPYAPEEPRKEPEKNYEK